MKDKRAMMILQFPMHIRGQSLALSFRAYAAQRKHLNREEYDK